MKPHLVFDLQRGATRGVVRDTAFALVAVATVVALLAWGHAVDEETAELADQAEAFNRGFGAAREGMNEAVGAAYRQGLADAMANLAASV